MRVLVGTSEICGWISLLQKELNKLGHDCHTLVKARNALYSSAAYTYDVTKLPLSKILTSGVLQSRGGKLNRIIRTAYLKSFVRRFASRYDLVIYIWDTLLPDFEDVKIFKEHGAKIIFWFTGSDVRTFRHFSNTYDVSQWNFPDSWKKEDETKKKQYVDVAEKYGDLIYSVPDQAGLQKRPYYHLQIPIDLSSFTFKNNRSQIPNVLHLPSDPWKKGTDVIEGAITELQKEGIEFRFHSYRNLDHKVIPAILQEMDILVDEIVFHGPGVLGCEAMASGCAVATRFLESSAEVFSPPVWNIDAVTIKGKLRQLFTDAGIRQALIEDGRAYIERNNDSALVVRNMIANLTYPQQPDYTPA
jgi:hypothetical protein